MRSRSRAPALFAALLLALPAARCRSYDDAAATPSPPRPRVVTIFSHARHGAARMARVAGSDEGAQCRYCHRPAQGGAQIMSPLEESCYACHTRADRRAPSPKACALCHVAQTAERGFVPATVIEREAPHDRRFFHESHAEERCATCHPTALSTPPRENPGRTEPGLCAACHGAIVFSHAAHARGQHLECTSCHAKEEKGARPRPCPDCGREVGASMTRCPRCGAALPAAGPDRPGVAILLPSHRSCYQCHPGAAAEAPSRDCLLCHDSKALDFAGPRAVPRLARGDLRGFSHEDHAKASCISCHVGERTRGERVRAVEPSMESCRACHSGPVTFEGKPVRSDCAACHERLRGPLAPADHGTLVRPIDHTQPFARHHGEVARDPGSKCFECHDLRTSCDACHAVTEPALHTLRFKRTDHGNAFDHDRSACVNCHRADFCSDCHSLESPPNHRYTLNFVNGGHRLAARRDQKRCYVCHSFGPDCSRCHP